MSDQDIANNWRLEETGEPQDRWQLQQAEQNSVAQWQLQDNQTPESTWQPIDYARERQGGSNWILPSLVILSLLAVVAYIAWIGVTRFNLLSPTTAANATETPVSVALDVTPIVSSTVEAPAVNATAALTNTEDAVLVATPTASADAAATPPASATPVRVEQLFITVSDPAGVNARSEPNTTSAVVKLLEPGARLLVAQEKDDWIEVALEKGLLAWVKGEVVERSSQLVSLAEANQRRTEMGLEPLASAPATAPVASTTVTGTTPNTLTAGVTNTLGSASPTASQGVTATINISTGLNARVAPTTTATLVKLLDDQTRYPVTGRSSDGQWLQIRLEDNTTAWIFAQYVQVSGNLSTVPVPLNATLATLPITTTITAEPTPSATSVTRGGEATATVSSLSGANARSTPDRNATPLNTFPFEAVLPVVGRSADNEWVQVKLDEGKLAWMLASAVKVSVDLATLPVVNP